MAPSTGRASDARFAHARTDPRFRRARRDDTKVVLDDRFKDVLQKKKGRALDRFGRHTRNDNEELRRMYRLEAAPGDAARGEVELESSSDEEDDEEDEEDDDDDEGPVVIGRQDAVRRAEAYESDDSIDLNEEDEFDPEVVAALDRQAAAPAREREAVARGDDTCRLAVVNMDWDHVHARDLYKVFASLVHPHATRTADEVLHAPKGRAGAHDALTAIRGQVRSVRVYVSDFGRERLAKEDVEGPPRAIFKSASAKDAVYGAEEGAEFDEDALRTYQLERLRYYYAIATFDSKESARFVYNEIDGTEMERSANVFDLRFVPDDMTFPDGEEGRDADFRDEATHDPAHYEGLDYKTDALRHSRVRLTWDQDDPRRSKVTQAAHRNAHELHDDDVRTYLASDSEDDDSAHAQSRDKLRSLLTAGQPSAFDDADDEESMYAPKSRANEGEMQITFVPALAPGASAKPAEDETTIERYLRKQKEKRERKKAKARTAEAGAADAGQPAEPVAEGELTFDDPFFASNDGDLEAALAAETGAEPRKERKARKGRKEPREPDAPAADAGADAGADADAGSDAEQHFSLHDIVRAEKRQHKKLSKQQRKREARRDAERTPLTQPSFTMDTEDPRFAAIKDDYRFAIDPHHPGFVKTAGMQQLLDASRAAHAKHTDAASAAPAARPSELASLVSSVKRHGAPSDRRTKRPRS
ncbi:pre-rRNA-processing protein esf1 [Malassezia brasiliensis]|uniref:Pre-rRNA-processing protein esf1 n=1 Tax=Malassezia brasiliensis TaxID=1821822 RepID=A0AAF0DTY7_9BASI|nr:pre-rRNA-processing protein esf1 [Malassezia brasiliensis]